MSRVDSALEALYEDASLRDELRDDEANELLRWAEAELVKLDESGATDADFESKIAELRQLVRGLNRFVGRRAEISAQAGDTALVKLTEHAGALGYALTPDQLAQFGAQHAADDGVSAVQGLTKLISSASQAAPAAEPPAEAAPPNELPMETIPIPEPVVEAVPPNEPPPADPPPPLGLSSFINRLFGQTAPPAEPSSSNSEESDPHGP